MSRMPPSDLSLLRDDPDASAAPAPDRWRLFPHASRGAPSASTRAAEEAVRLLTDAAFRPRDGN